MSHSHQPPQIQHLILVHIIKREGMMFLRLFVVVNRQFVLVFGIIGTYNGGALLDMLFVQFLLSSHYDFLNP
jgi:hypothetical protein